MTKEFKVIPKDAEWIEPNITGYIQEADEALALEIISRPVGIDTRSTWKWIRLSSGDLVLALYPYGDTYFETEIDRTI